MKKRFPLGVIAPIAVILLLAVAAGGWWYRASRPEYRFRQGQNAALNKDFDIADGYATALQESGRDDLAQLLQAEILFRQGAAERAVLLLKRVEGPAQIQSRAALLAAQCYLALKNPRSAEQALHFVLNH